jgi:hypothetical protein
MELGLQKSEAVKQRVHQLAMEAAEEPVDGKAVEVDAEDLTGRNIGLSLQSSDVVGQWVDHQTVEAVEDALNCQTLDVGGKHLAGRKMGFSLQESKDAAVG